MKQFIFLTIFFTIGLNYSCDKQDDTVVQDKFNTVVKFITPNENQNNIHVTFFVFAESPASGTLRLRSHNRKPNQQPSIIILSLMQGCT